MTLIPVTILVPENFLAELIANGVKVQVLPEKGQKYKKANNRSQSSKKVVTHPTKTSSPSKPSYPQRNNFLGGRSPSELFELYQHPAKPSQRKHLTVSEPCHRPGYLTASQLLALSANPAKVGKKYNYTADKDNLTPSKLLLAYKKQSGRPQLYKGLTASQLLVQHERQQSRSTNYKKYMSARLYPTASQLFNLIEMSKPSAQPPKKPSGQKPAQPKKQQQQVGKGKKEQMIQRITPSTEPRSLLEPTPSLLLLKHLSAIPSIGNQKKQVQPKVQKQKSQKELERAELRLEPLLFSF
jgi:hypothetical protein